MASIYRRGRIYYSDIWLGGKRVRKPLDTDRRIAESKLAELIKRRSDKKYGNAPRNLSWKEFKASYLEYSLQGKRRETYLRDLAAIKALEKHFPIIRLSDITQEVLERLKGFRRKDGVKDSTINRDLSALKAMMRKAEEWKYIDKQDWANVRRYKLPMPKPKYYTKDQFERLLAASSDHWKTVAMVGFYTGMRPAEIYWLGWHDVDFERGILWVNPKEGFTPKDFEARAIPMHGKLRKYLKGLRMTTPWVIGERPKTINVMQVYFIRILKEASLPGSLYWLRHSFGSHLAMANVNLRMIQKWMGHKSILTTQVYTHLETHDSNDLINKLPQ